ncbi:MULTISPECIES: hypothetical protein [Pyrococcus]|uniref:Uncharacterized protein n=1 Tax=Pyrococcus furiosus COM1 TaxID=1185654 RepID=I6UNS8_9EURY|nr:hypothetical protein [Pyrococcus furiosus]AFN03446.1 hypothetical protein PFC_02420 [Pyrococcus furiosus COM1]
MLVEALGKLAIIYAELNKKGELLNTLNDLKSYTRKNIESLENASKIVELLIRECIPIGEDFIERLKVLIHEITRENELM